MFKIELPRLVLSLVFPLFSATNNHISVGWVKGCIRRSAALVSKLRNIWMCCTLATRMLLSGKALWLRVSCYRTGSVLWTSNNSLTCNLFALSWRCCIVTEVPAPQSRIRPRDHICNHRLRNTVCLPLVFLTPSLSPSSCLCKGRIAGLGVLGELRRVRCGLCGHRSSRFDVPGSVEWQ